MHNWFECKISYDKILENGMQKKVSEPYLIDALSFTEAEARIIEEIKPYISGDFTVVDIKRARISEIFFNETGDRYYTGKVSFVTLNDKNGQEKKTSSKMIIQASDFKDALATLEKGMTGTLADYVIESITSSELMDVFLYADAKTKDLFSSYNLAESYNPESGKDPLFDEAVKLIMTHKEASTSQLQRNFSIGFNRAERLMGQIEQAGIVGPLRDNQSRQILVHK